MRCGRNKPLEDFDGNNRKCINCYLEYQAEYRKKYRGKQNKYWSDRYKEKSKDPNYNKAHYTMRQYGLTLQEYNKYFEDTPYCQSCGSDVKLVLDHDHITGKIRGVLCDMCNVGIGRLGDTILGVKQALQYLEDHYVESN